MSLTNDRRIFIAGANGATGRTLVNLPQAQTANLVPHYRPKSAQGKTLHPQAAVLDLTDAQALDAAMQGCTTVMQLIGTMRKRFSTGDTYETSDIDTTQPSAGYGVIVNLMTRQYQRHLQIFALMHNRIHRIFL